MGKKQRIAEMRQREHEKLKATFERFHKLGAFAKRVFRQRGINLPFYDFYDSYVDEFNKVASEARGQFPSLIGVFEAEDKDYFGSDRSEYVQGMAQIFWQPKSELNDYGTENDGSNINGFTNAFGGADESIKTLVLIRRAIPKSKPHREYKYILKLIALLHELGHVTDIERQINFNHTAKTCDLIEAEVFAHLYSIRRMAERNYHECFNILVGGLRKHATENGYLGEVARFTLERVPDHKWIDVGKILNVPFTSADLDALGPDGRKSFGLPT